MDYLIEKRYSGSTLNVHLSALKFFYEKVLNKKLTVNVFFKRTRKKDPVYLTKEELIHFLDCIENKKHKLMIVLLYSAGFRVSELVNLKVKDLNFDEKHGWVRDGKFRKDRIFLIAERVKEDLFKWIVDNKLHDDDYLFKGNSAQYSISAIRNIIKKAAMKSGLSKNISPHTLRHSFATHLAENKYSALEIQPLLGHKSVETTMIYTHMAYSKLYNVKSPYDSLNSSP